MELQENELDDGPTKESTSPIPPEVVMALRQKLHFKYDQIVFVGDRRIIEVAQPAELKEIIGLRTACSWREQDCTPNGTPFLKPMHEEELSAIIERGTLLVLKSDGEIAGTIYANRFLHQGTALIGGFAVHPKHQNAGNGPALLQEVLERIRMSKFQRAFSITASKPVAELFLKAGAHLDVQGEFEQEVEKSRERFGSDAHLAQGFVFDLHKNILKNDED